MSHQATAWVLEHSESRLGDRLVLLSIANHCDPFGDNAWPSVRKLAAESRVSERQVQRSIRNLAALGELDIDASAGPRGTNVYRLVGMSQPSLLPGRDTPDCQGDKLSGGDKSDQKGRQIRQGGVTNPTKRGDTQVTRTVLNSPEQSKSSTPAPDGTGRATPKLISELWEPNAVNRKWLLDAGLSPEKLREVINEFVRWARNSGIRRTPQGWQIAFSRNTVVKSTVGRSKSKGQRGSEDSRERDRRVVLELAKMLGIEQGDDDWPTFRGRVMGANDRRLAALPS